jgi:hypothetical protein
MWSLRIGWGPLHYKPVGCLSAPVGSCSACARLGQGPCHLSHVWPLVQLAVFTEALSVFLWLQAVQLAVCVHTCRHVLRCLLGAPCSRAGCTSSCNIRALASAVSTRHPAGDALGTVALSSSPYGSRSSSI